MAADASLSRNKCAFCNDHPVAIMGNTPTCSEHIGFHPNVNNSLSGKHNQDLTGSIQRLVRGDTYKDLSTVWITVTRGQLKPKVVSSWMALQRPMNNKFLGPIFFENMEVGDAYEQSFEMVMDHPELSKWKYILTVEEDNLPPSDGLLQLYDSIKNYDAVGGLYWTKGDGGQPMIYGNPRVMPRDFVPQVPIPDTIQHCNGLGMGFNLFRIAMFKKLPRPWFRTVQEKGRAFSQDLWFYNSAASHGFRFACDTRCKVGHLAEDGMVW